MTEPLRFIPPRVAITDPRTGLVSREWYLFFQGLFIRVGGADGTSTVELEASLFEDAGSSETNAMVFELDQATGQHPAPVAPDIPQDIAQYPAYLPPTDNITAELSELQARVAELVKEIDALKQSVLL